MNEELIKALTELANKFGVAIDWTSQNALPYVQELASRIIKFEVATSVLWMVAGIVLVISFRWWVMLIKYLGKRAKEEPYELYDFWKTVATVTMAATVFAGVCVIGQQAYDLIQCAILPEVVMLRYLGLIGAV